MRQSNNLIRGKSFQVKTEKQKLFQIETMLKNFLNLIEQLRTQINIEEQNSGVFDNSSYKYPAAAKVCKQRIQKLELSINDLQEQKQKTIATLEKLNAELSYLQRLALTSPRYVAKHKKA